MILISTVQVQTLELKHFLMLHATAYRWLMVHTPFLVNKTAFFELFCRSGGELSTRDLQKMVQALPQYSEQVDKLSLHVDVSSPACFLFVFEL